MKRQSYAQLTSNINDGSDRWKVILEISSQIFDLLLQRDDHPNPWQSGLESSDLPFSVGFGRMRLLEITGRKCHIHRNCVDLIMESRIDNSEGRSLSAWRLSNFCLHTSSRSPLTITTWLTLAAGLHFTAVNFVHYSHRCCRGCVCKRVFKA